MQIDFSKPILNLKGETVKDEDGKPSTLGSIGCAALLATYADEPGLRGDEKVKRFRLAETIYAGGVHEISVDDVSMLKTLIAKAFPPLIVARAFDIIEPPTAAAA